MMILAMWARSSQLISLIKLLCDTGKLVEAVCELLQEIMMGGVTMDGFCCLLGIENDWIVSMPP